MLKTILGKENEREAHDARFCIKFVFCKVSDLWKITKPNMGLIGKLYAEELQSTLKKSLIKSLLHIFSRGRRRLNSPLLIWTVTHF